MAPPPSSRTSLWPLKRKVGWTGNSRFAFIDVFFDFIGFETGHGPGFEAF
ncbi:MAG: hypothetical protein R3D26_24330 [Cyanobacteriota/Melainabacteria group bacterium]